MKILLVEDELSVSTFIKKGLEEQGFEVMQAFDGLSGYKLALQYEFDLIILDLVMPHMNGLEFCEKYKKENNYSTPILMLTALSSTDDIVLGLEMGADDYLAKPFKFKELLARIKALHRRSQVKNLGNQKMLTFEDLKMNLDSLEVFYKDNLIKLTSREFRLLKYLLQNKNRVVSRVDILENVWEVDFDLGTNVIDVYINYLRNKIEKPYNTKIISTVIGMGYIIKEV